MKLYIRWPTDDPHAMDDDRRHAVCGVDLTGAKKISDKQALVFLNDHRCPKCFAGHRQHLGQVGN